jgi:hypothetical protein
MHVSERTESNGLRKRRRQEVILGGRRSYSVAEGHTQRQKVILGGRRSYSAARGYNQRQEAILRRVITVP